MAADKPWLRYYGDVPTTIDYPRVTMYAALRQTAARSPGAVAYDFFGKQAAYAQFLAEIDRCATALAAMEVRPGDRVTIAMPTCPQAIICFYALNKLGAVASMIHPLSTRTEIEFYLNLSRSRFALTLDAFYAKFQAVRPNTGLETLILARIPDYLPPIKRWGFNLTKGRKIAKVPPDADVIWWRTMMAGCPAREAGCPAQEAGCPDREDGGPTGKGDGDRANAADPSPAADQPPKGGRDDGFEALAVILYSGGTTGRPKGIMLSNRNFICEGMQVSAWGGLSEGDAILAILPVFHGFGLGVCVNAAFMGGAKSILVPQFTPKTVAKLIRAKRPNFIVGVPTLYEALNRDPLFGDTDLSCLKAAFCGADTLPRCVKERFEEIVRRQGGDTQLREGFGLTEAVTAIMAMPMTEYRENSIGIPFPDMAAKIVAVGTTDELPAGEEGEICINGPAVMMGYLDQPDETAGALQTHPDGRVWLHTGDIGRMDEDGFFYYHLRHKRLIKSSGMNVYPTQVEAQLYKHPEVREACVIGVPDAKQIERVKAFVVLKDPAQAGPEMAEILIDFCRQDLIIWSCPREVTFRESLPRTLVGKVAYAELLAEELAKLVDGADLCRA
ncbi:MAG: AMP-binding protein [Desulfosarcinaceae bacterium]|nr:AMP-binding protein [Desulfosarcinaceae bacterium]